MMKFLRDREEYLKEVDHLVECDLFTCNTCRDIFNKRNNSEFKFNQILSKVDKSKVK